MSDAKEIVQVANEWLRKGDKVCLATIVRKDGSGPREVGAKMVISAGGKTAGTIGGGVVEARVIAKAQEVMSDGKPAMLDFDLSGDVPDLDASCGGRVSVFLEPLGETKSLFVLGAGHVGRALTRLATGVGFCVTLVDDRPEYLSGDDLPAGIRTVAAVPSDLGTKFKIDKSGFAVICTSGHSLDKEWLRAVAQDAPRYIGMLGSKHKAKKILDALREEGIPPEVLIQVHVPVGLDIGAITPDEIAVSIVGELIREWRGSGEGH